VQFWYELKTGNVERVLCNVKSDGDDIEKV